MNALPAASIPMPLEPAQARRLEQAVDGLTRDQLHWVSGYAAGLAAGAGAAAPAPVTVPVLKILYGSQTGNGEQVARELESAAAARGIRATLASLADFRPAQIRKESVVSLIVSTHGEGDPPDDAELFWEYLLSARAPALDDLHFSVLALGDSSYVNFCETGRRLDARLAELGATRFAPLVECDLDYEAPAAAWAAEVLDRAPLQSDAPATGPRLRAVVNDTAPRFDRDNPFRAEVLANQRITSPASSKDVRHIELSLEGSGIVYEPGDALAVIAANPPVLVDEIIGLLGLDPGAAVELRGETLPLAAAMSRKLEITAANAAFLAAWRDLSGDPELARILDADDPAGRHALIDTHQVVDVLRRFPAAVDASALVAMLRPLAPRSYSIASSLDANPGEVHLTVAAVRYEAFGREHVGAASTYLADRVGEGDVVEVFPAPNPRFRLPADDATPIFMIGPGTGVAPFRAFVEARAGRAASGDSWLFFGDREMRHDFLYQLEWLKHLRDGSLTRLDVAFSRDQAHKVYVQDRLRERGAEVFEWIERGACIYVCGDASRMAGDVHTALRDVLAEHGGIDADAAEARLGQMRAAGRYAKDVY